jgi:type II secretory pathway pseudopilin PulG
MELMLVLALLAVLMLIALPAFQSLLQSSLQQEVNHLSGVIRLLRNEAVLTNTRYRLLLDLKRSGYSVERQDEFGSYEPVHQPRELAPHAFPPAVELEDLVLLGRTYEPDEPEPLPIVVDASGYVDPFLLRFTVADEPYTLRVSGFTGRVELVTGHVEP